MKTSNFRLLVLVPHRDARLPLRAWSASLFATGFPGAWSFPWVAPIARLGRTLSSDELKTLAHALRRQLNSKGGKFIAGPPSLGVLCGAASVYGPTLAAGLDDDFYQLAADAIDDRITPLVLGSALVRENETGPTPAHPAAAPQISFRAAALANMSYGLLPEGDGQSGYSFEWQIGKLHWLPKNIK
jgi:hypothetical protein